MPSHTIARETELAYNKPHVVLANCADGRYSYSSHDESEQTPGWIAVMLIASIALVAVSGLATLIA